MSAKWKRGYQPDPIITKIEETESLDSDGKVRFDAFKFKDNGAILHTTLGFSDEIPEHEQARIILDSMDFNICQHGWSGIFPETLIVLEKYAVRKAIK